MLRERGIFARVALRWAEFQPANSQKFKYLGDDIEVTQEKEAGRESPFVRVGLRWKGWVSLFY